jgi:hypothetical protein
MYTIWSFTIVEKIVSQHIDKYLENFPEISWFRHSELFQVPTHKLLMTEQINAGISEMSLAFQTRVGKQYCDGHYLPPWFE